MTEITTEKYVSVARQAIKNQVLQSALEDLQVRFGAATALAYRKLPEGPELRLRAHDVRMKTIEKLDIVLEKLAESRTGWLTSSTGGAGNGHDRAGST